MVRKPPTSIFNQQIHSLNNNKNRLFVFGCSLTSYNWPSWADYIGVNYKEYYNYGRAGASNTYILNKFIEANELHKINSNDTVLVMLTGYGRCSFWNNTWSTVGDIVNYVEATGNPVMKHFLENLWNDGYGIYQSWVAIKTIKKILTLGNIPHRTMMGVDNSIFYRLDFLNNNVDKVKHMLDDINATLDIKGSLTEWIHQHYPNESHYFEDIKESDGHPSLNLHMNYAKHYFSELLSEHSFALQDFWTKNFKSASRNLQGEFFLNEFASKYNLACNSPLDF